MNGVQHSETERIAEHLLQRPIGTAVRARTRQHLLDWLGCVAGARTSKLAQIHADSNEPLIRRAAWLGNVLEMDDVHRSARLHPGPIVWPAALAVGGDRLDETLDAAVRGYDAMIAVGSMLDGRHYAYWHNTATAGVFGAAAAVACRLDLSRLQLVSALGLAGSVSGGLWQLRHEPGDGKQWHLAHAVATGTAAALLARRGVAGPRFILEGPQGLLAATCDAPRPLELSQAWRIEEVSFKPWGACRHAHPAIDAALELRARGALEGEVKVAAYRDALIFCDRPEPRTAAEAKFSIQHAVAIVMQRGKPRLSDFEPAAIEALADARRLVSLEEHADFTVAYPAHFGASVSCSAGEASVRDALGDPERPLTDAALSAKACELMEYGGLSAARTDEAVRTVRETDRVQDVIELLRSWL